MLHDYSINLKQFQIIHLFWNLWLLCSHLTHQKRFLTCTWKQKWPDRGSGFHHYWCPHHRTHEHCKTCLDKRHKRQQLQTNTHRHKTELVPILSNIMQQQWWIKKREKKRIEKWFILVLLAIFPRTANLLCKDDIFKRQVRKKQKTKQKQKHPPLTWC